MTWPEHNPRIRVATVSDLDGLTRTLTNAFASDPLWSWAIPDRDGLATWWRFLVESALRYPCTWIAGDYAAVSVWLPPDGVELTTEEEQRVEPLLRELVGPRAVDVLGLMARFDASHPRGEPHYYLSLLAVDNEHRGRGLGMELLAENLERFDDERVPTFLESSNPANDHRYERLGFSRIGEFTTPDGEHTVGTMWREAAPSLS